MKSKCPIPPRTMITEIAPHKDAMDAAAQDFLAMCEGRVEQYGDNAFFSFRQLKFLRSLWGRSCQVDDGVKVAELTGLALLKEKRRRILTRAQKHDADRAKENAFISNPVVNNFLWEANTSPVTARMRHRKSRSRQLAAAPILITHTEHG